MSALPAMFVARSPPLLQRGLPCLLAALLLLALWSLAATLAALPMTPATGLSVFAEAPTGGCPDRQPALGAIAEAGATEPRPASHRSCPRKNGDAGSVTTAGQVLRNAAADTRLRQVLERSRGYPLDPQLRLNHGHSPPWG
ncbi:MAG: hypothetical protein ACOH1V_04425 [Stenotrophomonas sp.]